MSKCKKWAAPFARLSRAKTTSSTDRTSATQGATENTTEKDEVPSNTSSNEDEATSSEAPSTPLKPRKRDCFLRALKKCGKPLVIVGGLIVGGAIAIVVVPVLVVLGFVGNILIAIWDLICAALCLPCLPCFLCLGIFGDLF
ncbi:hypothetical protein BJX99DRAFT_262768 [Aspergillus californicus]